MGGPADIFSFLCSEVFFFCFVRGSIFFFWVVHFYGSVVLFRWVGSWKRERERERKVRCGGGGWAD